MTAFLRLALLGAPARLWPMGLRAQYANAYVLLDLLERKCACV